MKIAVFGAGGVGGYFGGLLAHAGHEVHFIARGAHLAALRKHGLSVQSVNGDFQVSPVHATDTPSEVGAVEYLIVAVKHYHLTEAIPQLIPMVGEGTTVIPLLNGVDAHEQLAAALGAAPVVGGLCSIVSMIKAPGVIHQLSKLRRLIVGELDGGPSARLERIVLAWQRCGVEAIQSDYILGDMWTKFLFIASLSGINALANTTIGEMRESPPTRALYIEAMREIEALAKAQDIRLSPNIIEDTLKLTDSLEHTATASMQRDVAAGNLFELEAFNGKVVRLGEELGVPTPVHRALYGLLYPALERARQRKA